MKSFKLYKDSRNYIKWLFFISVFFGIFINKFSFIFSCFLGFVWLIMFFAKEKVEISTISNIDFFGEQDGEVEKEIKSQWKKIFNKFYFVREAYLPIVKIRESQETHLALCIYPNPLNKVEEEIIIKELIKPFQEIFNTKEYLDILFLTDKNRENCIRVCKAFYQK